MNIRSANINDLDNLLKIYIDGFKFHYNGRPDVFSNKTNENLKQDLIETLNSGSTTVIVLEENNYIIGFVSYQIKEKHSKVIWIDQLVIAQDERKKGYGKILMNEIYKIAKKEKCIRIEFCFWSFNENAANMYEHLGFSVQRKIYEMNVE